MTFEDDEDEPDNEFQAVRGSLRRVEGQSTLRALAVGFAFGFFPPLLLAYIIHDTRSKAWAAPVPPTCDAKEAREAEGP